jgi:hypothetical protein
MHIPPLFILFSNNNVYRRIYFDLSGKFLPRYFYMYKCEFLWYMALISHFELLPRSFNIILGCRVLNLVITRWVVVGVIPSSSTRGLWLVKRYTNELNYYYHYPESDKLAVCLALTIKFYILPAKQKWKIWWVGYFSGLFGVGMQCPPAGSYITNYKPSGVDFRSLRAIDFTYKSKNVSMWGFNISWK